MSYFIPVSSQLFENDKQQLDCNLRITTPRGQGSTGRSRLCRLHRNTQTASDSNDDINSPLRQPGVNCILLFRWSGLCSRRRVSVAAWLAFWGFIRWFLFWREILLEVRCENWEQVADLRTAPCVLWVADSLLMLNIN